MKRYGFASVLVMMMFGCGDGGSAEPAASVGADAGASEPADYDPSTTVLQGTLGASGAIKPIVSTLVISNSGETLIYMTTSPLTCEQLMVSRWLGAFSKDAQVIEIVVAGPPKPGPGNRTEVNWATGGRSSAYEQGAKTADVVFTKGVAMGVVEGTVMATYDKPSGDVSGHFHAEFCANGQGY